MNKIAAALLITTVIVALYTVRVQHEARRLFTELDRAQAEVRALEQEQARLEVEKRSLTTALRVEEVAMQKLGMHVATPAMTERVLPRVVHEGAATAPAVQGSEP